MNLRATRFSSRAHLWISIIALLGPVPATAQLYSGTGNSHEVFVGTETESYLRNVDLLDTTSNASWSIRPLSRAQITKLARTVTGTPWQSRLAGFAESPSLFQLRLLSPSASIRYNTAFPYGSNDGPMWAGRGATTSVQAGLYARIGPLSLTLLPTAFRAENASFPLAASVLTCQCGDPVYGAVVDKPQRFGSDAYQRFDPGQSSVRIDALGLNAGFSTANEGWGPSVEYPFTLGNNAPGFPHLFFGSSSPLPIFVGKAHLRVIYGRLDQTSYSPVVGSKFYFSRLEPGRVRFTSGVIATFQPRGFDGLEIGGARFIHSIWPRSGIPSSYIRKPLQAFLKVRQPGVDQQVAGTDNQLASFFARWAFRESGLEVYGEYGREDNSYDLRDLVQEPDHQRAYSLGLAKLFNSGASQYNVVRLELMNFQLPPLATTGRGEGSIYIHSPIRQGHTNRGQLLGADIGVGAAAASTVRWDHYSSGGRWAVFWRRSVRQETADPTLGAPNTPQISDVLHAFGFERLKFTRRFDVTTSLTLMRDLSRNFSDSRFNANAAIAITLPR
jgi:hypothetical protein